MVHGAVTAGVLLVLLFMDAILLLLYWWAGRRLDVASHAAAHRRFRRVYLLGVGLVNGGGLLLLVGFRTIFLPLADQDPPLSVLAGLPLQQAGALALFAGFLVVFGAVVWFARVTTREP